MARPSGRSISMAARAFSVDRGGIVQAAGSPDTRWEVHRRRLPATEGDWPGLIGTCESRREIRANQRRFPRSPRRTPVMFSLAFVVFNGPGSLEPTDERVALATRVTRNLPVPGAQAQYRTQAMAHRLLELRADTIREMLIARVEASSEAAETKSFLRKQIAALPGAALQTLTTRAALEGLAHVPDLWHWVQGVIGF